MMDGMLFLNRTFLHVLYVHSFLTVDFVISTLPLSNDLLLMIPLSMSFLCSVGSRCLRLD